VPNKIELCGRLMQAPELRTTPAGTPLLRLMIDCGAPGNELALSVVMAGERARTLAASLRPGGEVKAMGSLRAVRGRLRGGLGQAAVEVVAGQIQLGSADEPP
jgi:primosomal replication protein N